MAKVQTRTAAVSGQSSERRLFQALPMHADWRINWESTQGFSTLATSRKYYECWDKEEDRKVCELSVTRSPMNTQWYFLPVDGGIGGISASDAKCMLQLSAAEVLELLEANRYGGCRGE